MIRDVGLLWLGQALTKLLAFVAFALLARLLDTRSYGALEYAMGLAAFGALVIDCGLGTVGIRRLSQQKDTAGPMVALVAGAQLLLVVAVVPGICLFALLFANDRQAVALAALLSLGLVPSPWRQDWLFQATGRVGHVVVAQVVRAALFTLGVVVLMRAGSSAVLAAALEVAAAVVAATYLALVQARSLGFPRLRFERWALRGLAHEALPVGVAGVVWAIIHIAPLFLLGSMAGMAEAAYFGAAQRLAVTLVSFSFAYHVSFYPVIARHIDGDPVEARRFARASFRVAAWIGIAVALTMTLGAEPLLALLYGDKFRVAAPLLQILAWVFPITLLSGHVRWMLVAARRAREMLAAQLIGAAATLVACPILVWAYGAAGAAVAILLSSVVIWIAAHALGVARVGPSPLAPMTLPALLAAVLIVLARALAIEPWLACLTGVALYLGLALVVDRALLREARFVYTSRTRPAPRADSRPAV